METPKSVRVTTHELYHRKRILGLSRIELLTMVFTAAVLLSLLFFTTGQRPPRDTVIQCLPKLKEIGFGLHAFANEHHDRFPGQESATNGGSMEFVPSGMATPHFRLAYLAWDKANPAAANRVWVCPADTGRSPQTNYETLADANLSYFMSVDASPASARPELDILGGDRNLEAGGAPVRGLFTLTTNIPISWTAEMHSRTAGERCGNMLFVDGHVEVVRAQPNMSYKIQRQTLATNRLVIP